MTRNRIVVPSSPSASICALSSERSQRASRGPASCRMMSWNSVAFDDVVRRDLTARELRAAHEVEHPPHLLAGDHGLVDLAGDDADQLRRERACRRARRSDTGLRPGAVPRRSRTRARAVGFTTTVELGGASTSLRERVQRVAHEPVADLARLVVAHEDVVDDLVVTARARRVVRAVEHEVAPREREERVRVLRRAGGTASPAARPGVRARARPPRAAWCTSTRFDATPISRFARAPERSSPATVGRPVGRLLRQVLRQRRDDEVVVVLHAVRFGDDAPEPRLRHLVVGAVHQQHVGEAHVAELVSRSRPRAARVPSRPRGCRARSSTSRRGTRSARVSRRVRPTRTPSCRPLRGCRATRPRARCRRAGATAASARCARTCRGGSRSASRRRTARPARVRTAGRAPSSRPTP